MIVVTSDWHADATTMGVARFADIEAKVRRIVQLVIAQPERVTAFVFCGDLADPDSPGAWAAAKLAVEVAARLSSEGCDVPTLWLTGNHDVMEDSSGAHSLMPVAPVGEVVDAPRVSSWCGLGGVPVTWMALPFVPRSRAYDPEAFVEEVTEDVQVVFSHLCVEGIGPGSETKDFARGREVFLPLTAIRRKWPRARIVQGHYHNPQTYEGIEVVGSLERLTRSDVGERRGYLILR